MKIWLRRYTLRGKVPPKKITLHGDWSILTLYYSGDKIEKKEMGGACSTYSEE